MNERLELRYVPLSQVKLWDRNPKLHDLEAIASSVSEHGFGDPPKFDSALGALVYGNGRTEVLVRMREAGQVPPRGVLEGHEGDATDWLVPVLFGIDQESREAAERFAIAHNTLTLGPGIDFAGGLPMWDLGALGDLATSWPDGARPPAGFPDDWRAQLAEESASSDVVEDDPSGLVDRAEELRERWEVEPGQLWSLGGHHRLLCGDATSPAAVSLLMEDSVPRLCVTDPPYGVNYDPAWRNREAAKGHLAYAPSRVGEVQNDDRADWREAWALFPGDVIYSWHPVGAPSLVHAGALEASGFSIRMQIIWAKSNFPIGRGDYHVQHEPCWYAVRRGRPARRTKDRTQTTLWKINLDRNVEGGHSTQKPVECMARPIRNHDAPEIYDPFVGSGTSLVAAEQLDRKCYAMEIDPRYVAVALQRWADFTGKKPELVKAR